MHVQKLPYIIIVLKIEKIYSSLQQQKQFKLLLRGYGLTSIKT